VLLATLGFVQSAARLPFPRAWLATLIALGAALGLAFASQRDAVALMVIALMLPAAALLLLWFRNARRSVVKAQSNPIRFVIAVFITAVFSVYIAVSWPFFKLCQVAAPASVFAEWARKGSAAFISEVWGWSLGVT
jgi:predicted metal-binding membrane protein